MLLQLEWREYILCIYCSPFRGLPLGRHKRELHSAYLCVCGMPMYLRARWCDSLFSMPSCTVELTLNMDVVVIVLQEGRVPATREPGLPWQGLVVEIDTVQAVPCLIPWQVLENVQEGPDEVAFHVDSIPAEKNITMVTELWTLKFWLQGAPTAWNCSDAEKTCAIFLFERLTLMQPMCSLYSSSSTRSSRCRRECHY